MIRRQIKDRSQAILDIVHNSHFLAFSRWQGSSPLSPFSIVKTKERSYDAKHAHVMKYKIRKNESHKVEDYYECKLGSKFYMGPK
jgi:hypothetical protein